ncbi:MAG: ABC transporter ATP-binding protein [Pirellulales bacterium]
MYVETHLLIKRYGTFTALDQCTLAAQRGEVFGLLGPNGSGKTTLLRCLMGFLRPTSGRATIDTLDCYRDSVRVHERVAYLPGEARLFRRMRGRDVLRFFSQVRRGVDYRRALAIAERLGLDVQRPVTQMSTGMRQKLALAAVFAPEVPLVILDEPTSNLDPSVRNDVLRMIDEVKADGRTVLFSSHVLSEVEAVCDRVVILRRGELVHTQVMSELRRQHRIRARITGPLPPTPEHFNGTVRVERNGDDGLTIETPDELSPLLGWLAGLPLSEVRIEPVGLQTVYDHYHPGRAE